MTDRGGDLLREAANDEAWAMFEIEYDKSTTYKTS